ncbi:MAG: DnaJ domain-containing protein [Acidisphaera sp.]|nr:DnaJ domain-containing protein [Acidisphaera sp.]
MIWLLLGAGAFLLLMTVLRAFANADVRSIKALFAWILTLGGLALGVLLLLSGRGFFAFAVLPMLFPAIRDVWQGRRPTAGGGRPSPGASARPPMGGKMSREEAYSVLGLAPGAGEMEIRAAHRRLMRGVHPDSGGSDWLAARINQARDVLLGGRP